MIFFSTPIYFFQLLIGHLFYLLTLFKHLEIYLVHLQKKQMGHMFLMFFSISVKVIQLKREANALKNKKKVVELRALVLWSQQIELIHSDSVLNTVHESL